MSRARTTSSRATTPGKTAVGRTSSRSTSSPSPSPRSPRKPASLLLRGVDQEVLDVFRARAERHGRSLQAELQLSLRRAAHRNFDEARELSQRWRDALKERTLPGAKTLINEDRQR